MYQESKAAWSEGKADRSEKSLWSSVSWTTSGGIESIVSRVADHQDRYFLFEDAEFFANREWAWQLCRRLRESGVNILWGAVLETVPDRELLHEMRLAGCQRLVIRLEPEAADKAYVLARDFGFDISIANADGSPYAVDRVSYTVAEREAVAENMPGLHAAQFDLAVAYFRAGRLDEVMRPLGKAMTLGFPANELCLNLLACLSAARQYPDVAAGLLDQAQHSWPHPVVMRNRKLLRSWLESGGMCGASDSCLNWGAMSRFGRERI